MFFVLSKILSPLASPLTVGIVLLLLFAAVHRRRPRVAWWIFGCAVLLLYGLSIQPVADLLLLPLEGPFDGPWSAPAPDAIVVLGGSLDLSRSDAARCEFGEPADRFVAGLTLARQYPHATLIFSGGTASLTDRSRREGPLLRQAAIRLGVDARRIEVDAQSRNTRENAVETKRILDRLGVRTVWLVTSAFHMRRALGCFRKLGMAPVPHAVDFRNHYGRYDFSCLFPNAQHLENSTKALKEHLGMVAYRARGWL